MSSDESVFQLRDRLVADYAEYTKSFIKIADSRIAERVDSELKAGAFLAGASPPAESDVPAGR